MSVDGNSGSAPHGNLSPEERAALEQRSSDLGRKLEQARHAQPGGRQPADAGDTGGKSGAAMGRAMRLSAELIAGVLVGGVFGWYVDQWLGNKKPWFFIVFFLLGAAAGMLNLIRAAMRETTPRRPSVRDERDEDN